MSELNEIAHMMKKSEETARQLYSIFRGSYDSGIFGQDQSSVALPHWDDLPYYMRQALIFFISREPRTMRTTHEWAVSEQGDITISKVVHYDDGNSESETLTYIPGEALRFAILNATGQGDGISRSGEIETP